MEEISESAYWDYVSVQDQREGEESIKDLLKEAYDFASPFLNNLISYEGDMVYLNLVSDVSQTNISDIYGLSQLGVSKRVRSGINKLKTIMSIPETDKNIVREHFQFLLPSSISVFAILYYHYKTYSIVTDLMQESPSNVCNWVNYSIQILDEVRNIKTRQEFVNYMISLKQYEYEQDFSKYRDMIKADFEDYTFLAEKYYNYLTLITAQYNYGDYTFKGEGVPRNDITTFTEWSQDHKEI